MLYRPRRRYTPLVQTTAAKAAAVPSTERQPKSYRSSFPVAFGGLDGARPRVLDLRLLEYPGSRPRPPSFDLSPRSELDYLERPPQSTYSQGTHDPDFAAPAVTSPTTSTRPRSWSMKANPSPAEKVAAAVRIKTGRRPSRCGSGTDSV